MFLSIGRDRDRVYFRPRLCRGTGVTVSFTYRTARSHCWTPCLP